MTMYAALGALEQGLVYGIMVVGVYLTFRILDFPDLTVDGSLPLGAAISAVAITGGVAPYGALLLAAAGGFLAGVVTAVLNTKFKILHLLASILTMIALYSINIRIMSGPNIALIGSATVFDPLIGVGVPGHLAGLVVYALFAVAVVGALIWFLKTAFGQTLLATGDNPQMITSLGVNTHLVIIVGVGLSNALVALSGALVAQNQGAADVGMGIGTIIAGLASVIIGETIFGASTVVRAVIAALLGSVLYRFAIALALSIDFRGFSFSPSDLNLITALLVIGALVAPQLREKVRRR
ncbi:ABC transporter permease [Desulfofustis limnaeus]|jgi:putative ABC transport system permease protein|uniref:ABC transporter permease n=1 Tax=Desulfofustis limnaeus TaxID=2740163 RepID=A0ABM7WAV9_9BACT|nr:ABC transporter permease [Desulfofustis limnaeus]MDX9895406.1 ABC transporter permease [Desulfofustis sp.]BDD88105.1 ABC transporter permease [Desulfofustis limnaeus]